MSINGIIQGKFYNRLRVLDNNFLDRDVYVLMRYMNVKIGTDNPVFEKVMGCYGLRQMNGNGERLRD